jgi:hypothetical protein
MRGLVQEEETRRVGSWRDDVTVAAVAAGAAALVWAGARVLGVDLAVHSGSGTRAIGLVSVIVTATVVTLAAGGLLRVLERRTAGAGRLWTVVALAVLAGSLAGPAGAVTLSAGLALAAMHLVVGAAVIIGLRRGLADRGDAADRVA